MKSLPDPAAPDARRRRARWVNAASFLSLAGLLALIGLRWVYVLLFFGLLLWNLAGKRWRAALADLAFLACMAYTFPWYYRDFSYLHLQLFRPAYEATARRLAEEIRAEGQPFGTAGETGPVSRILSDTGKVTYWRCGDRVALLFDTSWGTNDFGGIGYIPDADSYEMVANLGDYIPFYPYRNYDYLAQYEGPWYFWIVA